MKPSPLIAAALAGLREDVVQAPGWFWPAMVTIALWGALAGFLVHHRRAAQITAAALEAAR